MDLGCRLETEARRSTAAIMSRIEVCITDPVALSLLRKHIGDVLHDSRRALIREFTEDGTWVGGEARVPKVSDHSTIYKAAAH